MMVSSSLRNLIEGQLFLQSIEGVRNHLRHQDQQIPTRLRGLLGLATQHTKTPPGLILIEQPGCWLYPSYTARSRLLHSLISTGMFSRERSGVFALETDTFSAYGEKRSHVFMNFAPGLAEVNLLGESTIRRFEHQHYTELTLEDRNRTRLSTIFTSMADLVTAAGEGTSSLARYLEIVKSRGLRTECLQLATSLNSANHDILLASLKEADLNECVGCLRKLAETSNTSKDWFAFWRNMNEESVNGTISDGGGMWSALLQSVENPVPLAKLIYQELDRAGRAKRFLPIAFANSRACPYNTIYMDMSNDTCIYLHRNEPIALDWGELRHPGDLATGYHLSGLATYLVFAAHGLYMILDRNDALAPFQIAASNIYQRLSGTRYPWLRLQASGNAATDRIFLSDSFMEMYSVRREDSILALLAPFYAGELHN